MPTNKSYSKQSQELLLKYNEKYEFPLDDASVRVYAVYKNFSKPQQKYLINFVEKNKFTVSDNEVLQVATLMNLNFFMISATDPEHKIHSLSNHENVWEMPGETILHAQGSEFCKDQVYEDDFGHGSMGGDYYCLNDNAKKYSDGTIGLYMCRKCPHKNPNITLDEIRFNIYNLFMHYKTGECATAVGVGIRQKQM